jgi:hypothetical protein
MTMYFKTKLRAIVLAIFEPKSARYPVFCPEKVRAPKALAFLRIVSYLALLTRWGITLRFSKARTFQTYALLSRELKEMSF